MKRALALLLALLLMLASLSALAEDSVVAQIIDLMNGVLSKVVSDEEYEFYYDSEADAVLLKFHLTDLNSYDYFTYGVMLQSETEDYFELLRSASEHTRSILDSFSCSQCVISMALTSDGVPIAIFCNGAKLCTIP